MYAIESISLLAGAQPHWFHPRLRFFSGREHKLPVDQHMLMAMVAPRGLMIFAGYAESAANPFALEQAYRSAMTVYRFHQREDNLWLHLREGEHSTETGDIEIFMDFFDTVFGRKKFPKSETWVAGYEFEAWKRATGVKVDALQHPRMAPGDFLSGISTAAQWDGRKAGVRGRIAAALGPDAPGLAMPPRHRISEFTPPARTILEQLLARPTGEPHWRERLRAAGMGLAAMPFGEGLSADLYYPLDDSGQRKPGKFPVVVWLHPYTYGGGWSARRPWEPRSADYILDQRPSFVSLVKRGFAVLAFDQIGFGSRIHHARRFYGRYPEWSLMGKMVADTRAAVASLKELEDIDSSRIYLLGYALGAKVGLFTAAFDESVRGVAAVCGVDALRLSGGDDGIEGLRHYSHLHGLIPRLGFFLGQEPRVPFDYDEVLALAAPRPVLVVAPTLDRYAPVDDVRQVVEASRKVYRLLGSERALTLETPLDFNRFTRGTQERVFDWLLRQAR